MRRSRRRGALVRLFNALPDSNGLQRRPASLKCNRHDHMTGRSPVAAGLHPPGGLVGHSNGRRPLQQPSQEWALGRRKHVQQHPALIRRTNSAAQCFRAAGKRGAAGPLLMEQVRLLGGRDAVESNILFYRLSSSSCSNLKQHRSRCRAFVDCGSVRGAAAECCNGEAVLACWRSVIAPPHHPW